MWATGSAVAAGVVALTMWLSAGSAAAIGQPDGILTDDINLLQFMSPSLGAGFDGIGSGWSDRLYKHPHLWVTVSGGRLDGDGFVKSNVEQVQIGDVTATSTVSGMTLYGLGGLREGGHALITGNAMAVGNLSEITICLSASCDGTVAPEEAEEIAAAEEDNSPQPVRSNPGITAISRINGFPGGRFERSTETRTPYRPVAEWAGEQTLVAEEDSAEASAADHEASEQDDDGIEINLVMLPNLGSGIDAQDWWLPGMGGVNVSIAPEVLVLNRILVERKQLVIGDVVATATAETIEAVDVAPPELAASEQPDADAVNPALADLDLNAVALGNAASISSDAGGLAIDRQIVIGSVDGVVVLPTVGANNAGANQRGTLSGALFAMMVGGEVHKAEIKAEASADYFAAAMSDLNATALANNHSINGNPTLDGESLVMTDLVQIAYADEVSKVVLKPGKFSGGIDFSAVATAVGNMSDIKVSQVLD